MTKTWKLVIRTWKTEPATGGRPMVEKAILEASGVPLKIRHARRSLLWLTTRACRGQPSILEADEGLVCFVALDDLVDIVMDPAPTLAEVMGRTRPSTT